MSSSTNSKKLQIGPSRKRDSSLILDCFQGVTSLQPYCNKWISVNLWLEIIHSRYDLVEDLLFSSKELGTAISKNKVYKANNIESTAITNPLGLYKAWKKNRDKNNKSYTIVAYYSTLANTLPLPPGGITKWYDNMVSMFPGNTSTRSTQGEDDGQ